MKNSIAIVGFMGSGKTTTAKLLGARLHKQVIEPDELVEMMAGKTIVQIFEEVGEEGFRKLEMEALKEATEAEDAVISCGGGVITSPMNIERLKKHAMIILLLASPETIFNRIAMNNERPLLAGDNKLEKIKTLLKERDTLYKKISDFQVDTTRLKKEEVAEKILEWLGGKDGNHD